jgi:predicted nucleic acid-binding protein
MTEKPFLDTNILLYGNIDYGSKKHLAAKSLLKNSIVDKEVFISVQVINEFYANALRKGQDNKTAQKSVGQFIDDFNVIPLTLKLIPEAFRILNRYQLSYWDSLIIAAALEADCTVLYTEDLQDGMLIDNTLKIINPFSPEKPL